MWEGEQGREFLVNNQRFLQYVEERWELHRIEKEKEKQERVNKETCRIIGRACLISGTCVDFSLDKLRTASEEEQTDGGGHAVRNSSADAHQTQIPRQRYAK